jgi:hypothetical protein
VRFRRTLSAATLAVLAMGGLSACQTKVGMAASAAGHRLSDSDLTTYVQAGAAPYTDQNSNTTVVPKLFALENWVNLQLFTAAVTAKGGAPKPAELAGSKTAILGGRSMTAFEKIYTKLGYTKKLADLILNQGSTLVVLVERLAPGITADQAIQALQSGQAGATLVKTVNATKPKVVVSPRYGAWDPTLLSLNADPRAGLPNFVVKPGGSSSAVVPAPAP